MHCHSTGAHSSQGFRPAWGSIFVLFLACGGCASTARQVSQSERLLEEGDGYFDSRQRQQALAAYQFAMVAADQEHDADRWVEATAQIGHVHVLDGNLAAGEEWIQRSAERLGSSASAARARWLIAEGSLERARSEPQAQDRFAEAFAIASAQGLWARAIQAAYMASLVAQGEDRVEWARRALEVSELARRPEWAGALEMVLARELEAAGAFSEATESYRSARSHLLAQGDRMQAAAASIATARNLRIGGRIEEARSELDAVRSELDASYERLGGQWSAELLARQWLERARVELADARVGRASECLRAGQEIVLRAGLDRAVPALSVELDRLRVQVDGSR